MSRRRSLAAAPRFGIRLSTADTIEIPGTCAYWRVMSATYSVSNVSRSASPAATCSVMAGIAAEQLTAVGGVAQHARLDRCDGRRVRDVEEQRDLPDQLTGTAQLVELDAVARGW